jgi:hypothetical protein
MRFPWKVEARYVREEGDFQADRLWGSTVRRAGRTEYLLSMQPSNRAILAGRTMRVEVQPVLARMSSQSC